MQQCEGVALPREPQPENPPSDMPSGEDTCVEIIARYDLLRYNLFKEKYETHGNTFTE